MKGVDRQPSRRVSLGQEWGARVAARRELLGLTQVDLAGLCGVTQQTISKIERGAMVPLDRLKIAIARALATTPADLFAWPPGIESEVA